MNPKKGMQPQPTMQSSQSSSAAKSTTTTGVANAPTVAATSRYLTAKPVPELTHELAATMFMINRSEKSGQVVPQAHLDKVKELTAELKNANVEFFGLLGKCIISGNDCHFMSPNLDIVEHVSVNQSVPADFERARSLIPSLPPQAICLMVYSHQIECLYVDGSTQVLERI